MADEPNTSLLPEHVDEATKSPEPKMHMRIVFGIMLIAVGGMTIGSGVASMGIANAKQKNWVTIFGGAANIAYGITLLLQKEKRKLTDVLAAVFKD